MATHKLMIAGFGGQGVLLIGQMIAYAAVKEGKEVTWMPSYGPEMRGGTANCPVVVSDKPIAAPLITEATAVVAMNGPSLDKFESMVIPGGDLFVNSSQPDCEAHRTDVNVHNVDLVKIADDLGNQKVANMVMLGAIVRTTGVVSLDSVKEVIREKMTGKKAALVPLNEKALESWTK